MNYIDISKSKVLDPYEELLPKLLLKEVNDQAKIKLKACVHKIQIMSDFNFVFLRTARRVVQCVHISGVSKFSINELKEGDFIEIEGYAKQEPQSRTGYDVVLTHYKLLESPKEPLPIVVNKKKLNALLETKLDYRPISLRNPAERAIFKLIDGILIGFRKFLNVNGFTEFIAPKIVSAGAESGADMFELDYFGKKAYLAQSPQIYKQMMVGVFERVFTVGPVFRAEKHRTSRHINEFTGIDIEMGYIDSFYDIMDMETRMLAATFEHIVAHYADELDMIGVKVPSFSRIPVVKFMEVKNMIAEKYTRKFKSIDDLEPEEERLIGELFQNEYNSNLVFVTHYPSTKRPFYTYDDPMDKGYTFSFDLLLNGSEITTGGQRIHNYEMQVEKMKSLGMDCSQFESYLMIHKYGMPPHGGLGLGLERVAMKLFNHENIRDTTLFPRDIERLNP